MRRREKCMVCGRSDYELRKVYWEDTPGGSDGWPMCPICAQLTRDQKNAVIAAHTYVTRAMKGLHVVTVRGRTWGCCRCGKTGGAMSDVEKTVIHGETFTSRSFETGDVRAFEKEECPKGKFWQD